MRALDQQHLVAAHAEAAIGEQAHLRRREVDTLAHAIQHDEVVAQALHLGELERCHWAGGAGAPIRKSPLRENGMEAAFERGGARDGIPHPRGLAGSLLFLRALRDIRGETKDDGESGARLQRRRRLAIGRQPQRRLERGAPDRYVLDRHVRVDRVDGDLAGVGIGEVERHNNGASAPVIRSSRTDSTATRGSSQSRRVGARAQYGHADNSERGREPFHGQESKCRLDSAAACSRFHKTS